MERFIALYDVHVGYERRGGHKVSLHDERALNVALQFMGDFKPDHVILGGDILDCGVISHHNHGKPGATEGFKLLADAEECRAKVIKPIETMTRGSLTYITGNHEDWLTDLSDSIPAIEGIIGIRPLLKLGSRWTVKEQGEAARLGKLVFIHGDQIKGGENAAKNAVIAYERNIRLGHFHTFQTYTKTSAVESISHTGMVVPCLAKANPRYNEGAPNKWIQGFLWGYVGGPEGSFNDYVTVIVGGKATVNGKLYRG